MVIGCAGVHQPLNAVVERGDVALHELDGISYLTYPALDALPGVRALTTLRESGTTHKPHRCGGQWLDRFIPWLQRALDVPEATFCAGEQVHGTACMLVGSQDAPRPGRLRRFIETDALLTTVPAVGLIVITADCVPVFLAEPAARAVGIIHAGKAGTGLEITGYATGLFYSTTSAERANTTALIGPSIGDGCYPVRLWDENVRQLRDTGLERIITPAICTRCNLDRFYSYRAEKGCTGRMVSAIILAEA
ncbi:MAG: polyphenol oxidase family protein [Verrucomicrobia bacterium]|nr:polyphenol oxidase family protein [Verrucomicrobiota bacterium]